MPHPGRPLGIQADAELRDEHVHGGIATRHRELIQEAVAHGTPCDVALQMLTTTGRLIWTRSVGDVEIKDGKAVALAGAFQDISARKATEAERLAAVELTRGTQIQIPMAAARRFFGLHEVGETTTIRLQPKGSTEYRALVVTVFTNNTVRLSVNELEYRDRPCVMVFRKSGANRITFETVPESIFPTRYRELLSKCEHQTRAGSRRWTIV